MISIQNDTLCGDIPLCDCLPSNMQLILEMYASLCKKKQSGIQWLNNNLDQLLPQQHGYMHTYESTIRYCKVVLYFYNLLCSRCNPLPNEMAILLLPGQNVQNDLSCAHWFFNTNECKESATIFGLVCKMRCFKKPSKHQIMPVAEINLIGFKRSKAACWPYFQAVVDLFPKMREYVDNRLVAYNLFKCRDKRDTTVIEERRLVVPSHRRRKSVDWTDFLLFAGVENLHLMQRVPFISAALQSLILTKFAYCEQVHKLVFY